MKTGIELIAEERKEQVEKHGFDTKHDVNVNPGTELAKAAIFAITLQDKFYPNEWEDWAKEKIWGKTYKERLTIAGALIAAEIDRLQNIEQTH